MIVISGIETQFYKATRSVFCKHQMRFIKFTNVLADKQISVCRPKLIGVEKSPPLLVYFAVAPRSKVSNSPTIVLYLGRFVYSFKLKEIETYML